MDSRSIGDNQILSATEIDADGNNIKYTYTLPSGRKVVSDWMPAGTKFAIQWCEAVREQMAIDERKEGREAESRHSSKEAPSASAPLPASSFPSDPDEFIKAMYFHAAGEAEAALTNLQQAEERNQAALEAFGKWKALAENAGIDLTEESNEDESDN